MILLRWNGEAFRHKLAVPDFYDKSHAPGE